MDVAACILMCVLVHACTLVCYMLHACLCVCVCSSLICECMLEVSMFSLVHVYVLVNASLVVYM